MPRDYQSEVVRSALALKLHQYEDTGALAGCDDHEPPRAPRLGSNLGLPVLLAPRRLFHAERTSERLGHSEEMERFLEYLRNIAEEREGVLQPAYRINGSAEAPEQELDHLSGFNGDGPVRIGNQAFEHVQNDVYGEMCSGSADCSSTLVSSARFRRRPPSRSWSRSSTRSRHGSKSLMRACGSSASAAGCTASRSSCTGRARGARSRSPRRSEPTSSPEGARGREARSRAAGNPVLERRRRSADPGRRGAAARRGAPARRPPRLPDAGESPRKFACRRDPLRALGRRRPAPAVHLPTTSDTPGRVHGMHVLARRGACHPGPDGRSQELFEYLLSLDNGLGLYSEDILPDTLEQSGNFPQTYSHVGLINAAFRLSRRWTDTFAQDRIPRADSGRGRVLRRPLRGRGVVSGIHGSWTNGAKSGTSSAASRLAACSSEQPSTRLERSPDPRGGRQSTVRHAPAPATA